MTIKWHIEKRNINDLKHFENNPRTASKENLNKLNESIKSIGMAQPINITLDNVVLSGNMRLEVLKQQGVEEVEVYVPDTQLTERQQKEIVIRMNSNIAGDWDYDLLANEWEVEDLQTWGVDIPVYEEENEKTKNKEHGKLINDFIIPPFSVFDTRQGYWQDRKREWLNITGNLTETKENVLGSSIMSLINEGSSNFDPVLAEIIIKWFNRPFGKILDPFGGEQTKGVVSGELGFEYHAVEIRQEQVNVNIEKTKKYKNIKYYCGDSNNISKIINERQFDLCFTSPPYYDLEVYSKDDMSSLGTYEEFMEQYKNIFQQCFDMLKENTFLVIKIGEIRDKKNGEYFE